MTEIKNQVLDDFDMEKPFFVSGLGSYNTIISRGKGRCQYLLHKYPTAQK